MNSFISPTQLAMPDVQSSADTRLLAISQVGVRGVRMPVQLQLASGVQGSVGIWQLDVALPAHIKGTHMSRFVALLNELEAPLCAASLQTLGTAMLARLEATEGRLSVEFTLFIKKTAPVTAIQSFMDYQARFAVHATAAGTRVDATVVVPVKSLCPCSKEISDFGAHNQRSHITITAELKGELSLEQLIRYAEEEASSEIFALLKRPDEKFVTERAYNNPKFVEDLVRDVAGRLNADAAIGAYTLEAENFESIHNHSAWARMVRD
jgi:GTP cyclohydrolase IB